MNFKIRILIIFKGLLIYRKFKSLMLWIWFLVLNDSSINDGEYKRYAESEAEKICNRYVLNQRLYLDKKSKEIVDQWSSRYYQGLNEYIRGLTIPSDEKIMEFEDFRKELSALIQSTKGLDTNTVLFRGEKNVDVESRFRIGEEGKFLGFTATSFSKKTAENFSKSLNSNAYIIKIKAKKNTKGIAINGDEVGVYRNQKEWLLDENQKYITVEVDQKNKIIEIELL